MANIKNMQMWKTICNDTRFSVSKSFFGLKTTIVYLPTNSVIDGRTVDYLPSDGERVRKILTSPKETLAEAIGDFRPEYAANGNYVAEVCESRDDAFIAVQLFQYSQLRYDAVTEPVIFTGDETQLLKQIL
ncbi:MAG: hypothetical protein J5965_26885 [Aeriscardovia sp.]|nr:hypothetical protein [Aeriscardovia sp.]